MRDNIFAALDYIERGWHVLPLHNITEEGRCSCGRACKEPGKHPRTSRGLHDASVDAEQITDWWTRWPSANVGIRTGRVSNLWVLDIDAKRSVDVGRGVLIPEGENTLRTLEDRAGEPLPDTLISRTGGGGTHYLFTYPQDGETYTNRVNVAPSIDVRADNGYIVAPPSLHASGKEYRWDEEEIEPAAPPTWLLTLQDKQEGEGFQALEEVPEGSRNEYLFKFAAKLRGEDREPGELGRLVMAENLMVCKPPLDRGEVIRIVGNVLKNYEPNPPQVEWVWDEPSEAPEVKDGDLVFLSFADLIANPPKPKEPLIYEGVLDKGDGFVLGGQSGAGKSWMAFDLGVAVATGQDWMGRFATEQGTVLYIDEEAGVSSDWERMKMIARGQGIPFEKDPPPFMISSMKGIKLDTPRGMTIVARALEQYRPTLVIFDALVRFHNGDENSAKDMAEFFEKAKSLKEAFGTAFMFLHHVKKPAKDDSEDWADLLRGSGDVRGWPDGIFVVKPTEDKEGVVVAHAKSRNHRQLRNFEVRREIDNEEGIARLVYVGDAKKTPNTPAERQEQIVEIVQKMSFSGPVTIEIIAARSGLTLKTAIDYVKVLVGDGQLLEHAVGKEKVYTLPPDARNMRML